MSLTFHDLMISCDTYLLRSAVLWNDNRTMIIWYQKPCYNQVAEFTLSLHSLQCAEATCLADQITAGMWNVICRYGIINCKSNKSQDWFKYTWPASLSLCLWFELIISSWLGSTPFPFSLFILCWFLISLLYKKGFIVSFDNQMLLYI